MIQIDIEMPVGCIYEGESGKTEYCPLCNHDDVPYCQYLDDDEAALGIDERPYYCPLYKSQPQWIPCSERLPEEDHWLGGSGRQFSDEVLVSVANYDDEDTWTYISQTVDGNWALELPRHCEIVAWQPLPEPYKEG